MTKKAYLEGLNDLNCMFNHLIDDLVVVCKDYQNMFLYFAWRNNECPKQMSQRSGVTDFLKVAEIFKEDDNTGICVRKLLHKNKKLAVFGLRIIMHKQRKITEEDVFHSFSDEGVKFSEHLANIKEDLCEIKCLKKLLQVRFDAKNDYRLKEHMIIDNWCPCKIEEEEKCTCECKNNEVCCKSHECLKEEPCACKHEESACCAAKHECSSCKPHDNGCCASKCSSCCKEESDEEKIAKQTCGCKDHVCEGNCCRTGKEITNPCHCPASAPCGGKCGDHCTCHESKQESTCSTCGNKSEACECKAKSSSCTCPSTAPCQGKCNPCTCHEPKNECGAFKFTSDAPKSCKCPHCGGACHCPSNNKCNCKNHCNH